MSEEPATLQSLKERRTILLTRKRQLLMQQQNDVSEPGPSSMTADPINNVFHVTIERDLHDYSSDDSIADPDFVLPSNRPCNGTNPSSTLPDYAATPATHSFFYLEELDDFPERSIGEEQNSERKRKKKADQDSWKRESNKKRRMMGKEYLGFRKVEGKNVQDVVKAPRQLGLACISQRCITSKVFACNIFSEEMRLNIFNDFWRMSWKEKKIYVLTLIDVIKTKRSTTGSVSRRIESKIYYLKAVDKKVRVCQGMFLGTLGIKEWTCRYWLAERTQSITEPLRPSVQITTVEITKKTFVLTFLHELPKLPSHYCRRSSRLLYLEPIIKSKAQLYRIYVARAISLSAPVACRKFFETLLSEQNIALFKPKKDECDTCCSYKVGNITEIEYQQHVLLKETARQEKRKDKEAAMKSEIHALTADLQAVMLCPYLNASAIYFKTKLCVHNFTVYNLANHQATCYWFDETVTDLKATTYASLFVDYLTNLLDQNKKDVIIYTDGCTAQNRNNIVSNALLRLAVAKQVTITQKFLEKGHTQMECDSVHSVIERKIKNREIFLPSQYAMIAKEARVNPSPYDVVMPEYSFFRDYSQQKYHVYDSIRPGRVAGDRCVTDIRVLRYNTNGTIDYKLLFSEDFTPLPRRPKPIESLLLDVPQLHARPLKINKNKFNHLQELKNVIPKDCHYFYDNLTYHE